MDTIKKFNEMNESNSYDGMTLKEFLGEIIETKNGVSLTSNGIYTDSDENWIENWGDHIIELNDSYTPKNIYSIYVKKVGEKYGHDFGKVLFKDDKPFILTGIPGDDRGAIVFNGTFISSGHDGNLLFNTSNPFDYQRATW
jgi:hypothetical protein